MSFIYKTLLNCKMDKLTLSGDLERNIVLEKIIAQSKKDEKGRRHSFRVTQEEIKKELKSY